VPVSTGADRQRIPPPRPTLGRRWPRPSSFTLLSHEGAALHLFVSAFNLLIGYVGLLSFGHAAFFGGAPTRRR
jgi:ABC-type branched-subunit amino acid transport system permease subunit